MERLDTERVIQLMDEADFAETSERQALRLAVLVLLEIRDALERIESRMDGWRPA